MGSELDANTRHLVAVFGVNEKGSRITDIAQANVTTLARDVDGHRRHHGRDKGMERTGADLHPVGQGEILLRRTDEGFLRIVRER